MPRRRSVRACRSGPAAEKRSRVPWWRQLPSGRVRDVGLRSRCSACVRAVGVAFALVGVRSRCCLAFARVVMNLLRTMRGGAAATIQRQGARERRSDMVHGEAAKKGCEKRSNHSTLHHIGPVAFGPAASRLRASRFRASLPIIIIITIIASPPQWAAIASGQSPSGQPPVAFGPVAFGPVAFGPAASRFQASRLRASRLRARRQSPSGQPPAAFGPVAFGPVAFGLPFLVYNVCIRASRLRAAFGPVAFGLVAFGPVAA